MSHCISARTLFAFSFLLVAATLRAAITDSVDFNSGAITDNFLVNIQGSASPYSLAPNGLAGTQGIALVNNTSADATLIFKSKGYDLSTLTSLDVTCYIQKQTIPATGAGTGGLSIGLAGESNGYLGGYNDPTTTNDAFALVRLGVNGTAWRLQTQYKPGNTAGVTNPSNSANLATTDGNWYQLHATFVRTNATTLQVTGTVYNSDANGNLGTQIGALGPTSMPISDITGQHQVWVGLRGFGPGGAAAWDNVSIVANGVNVGVPAAPTLSAAGVDAYHTSLSWVDNSVNEDSFVVSRSTTSGGPYTDLATLPANTTTYTDSTVNRGLDNYYVVRAVSTAGSSSSNEAAVPAFQSPYYWKNVAIGGGGYVTGIFLHPTQPNLVYVRTDVGGFYRWDATNLDWVPITDALTLSNDNDFGGEGLALDPNNPNIVYIAGGKYSDSSHPAGVIFKSMDQGATWTQLSLSGVQMGGNEPIRSSGERLVVCPTNSSLLLFGSRNNGLWRSTDAGATWAQATGFPGVGTTLIGITSIVFDQNNPGLVYAALYNDSVYSSPDYGVTWSRLNGGPTQVNRMAVSSTGALLATHEAGVSTYAAGAWTLSVPGGAVSPLYGLSINPANSNDVLVAEGESTTGTRIYRSSDGGGTWTQLNWTLNNTVPWYTSAQLQMAHLAAIEFDPQVAGRVWTTDWYGVWHTDDINASPTTFTNQEQGHEEIVAFSLAAPASGTPLISGMADVDGFNHSAGLSVFPAQRMGIPGATIQDTYCIAVCESDPTKMVRCAGNRTSGFQVLTSTDGGTTWSLTTWGTQFSNTLPLRAAISPTDPTNFVVVTGGDVPRVTTDGGTTWQSVTGLPTGPSGGAFVWMQPLTADRQLAGTFYYTDGVGNVYASTNKGLTFARVNTSAALPTQSWTTIRTLPGAASDLWVSVDTSGLYHSTNGGATFTSIATVNRAYLFAFGKPAPGATTPALYLYGRVNGSNDEIFSSPDLGQTWTELTDPNVAIGDEPNVIEASAQTYGRVYLGTNGRGIFTGQARSTVTITSTTPAAELNSAPGAFVLTRSGDLTDSLTVIFTLQGTATAGTDYTPISGTVTFAAGSSSATVTITPIAQDIAAANKTVTLTLSNNDAYYTGSSSTTLSIANKPFDTWLFNHGLTAAQANDDPDHDGLSNLLEYALGTDPNVPAPAAYPVTAVENGQLTMTYQVLCDPTEISYTVEVSSDLVHWASGPANLQQTTQPDGITVVCRDLTPINSNPHFIRLRVTRLQ